jgi:hypothetical protein
MRQRVRKRHTGRRGRDGRGTLVLSCALRRWPKSAMSLLKRIVLTIVGTKSKSFIIFHKSS